MSLLNSKNILLISPEPWEHLAISKHHYAIELAKRKNTVYFLGPPQSKFSIEKTSIKNVFKLNYKGFPKGLRFYPKTWRRSIQRAMIKKIERLIAEELNIIWSFDNSVFTEFEKTDSRLNISHIVDNSQNFSFANAAKNADVNFAVSNNILEKQKVLNPNSFKIAHAIDEEFFNERYSKLVENLPGNNKLKAMTFGNLKSPYIDWTLAEKVYRKFQNIDFIHFGPCFDNQKLYENTFFPGKREKSELAALMQSADFLFIFYDSINHKEQLTNSHKILEFLSSGKAIICNEFSDYKNSDLLFQCKKYDEFIDAIESIIKTGSDPNMQQKRIEFAAENTYKRRLDEIEKILEKR